MSNYEDIADLLMRVINTIIFSEKKNVFRFEGATLYPSEVHLILLIHKDLDRNATRMAEKLGLTKGAVSQTLSRLEKKGILEKIKDPYNKNELTIAFTRFGEKALAHCLHVEERFKKKMADFMATQTEAEQEAIRAFLEYLGGKFEQSG